MSDDEDDNESLASLSLSEGNFPRENNALPLRWQIRFLSSWIMYDYEAATSVRGGRETRAPANITFTSNDEEEIAFEDQESVLEEQTRHRYYLFTWWHRSLHQGTRLLLMVACAAAFLVTFYERCSLSSPYSHGTQPFPPPTLSFRQVRSGRSEFKIVQITDIHLGEAEDLAWGPRQDRETWKTLDAVLTAEAPIDLIVLGGDQLTANNCKDNATQYYQELGEFLSPYGIPWALIFGNHDDADFETRDEQKIPAKYSRRDLLVVDQNFPLSLTQAGPTSINGTTNYFLNIHESYGDKQPDNKAAVAAQIFLLDSGGGSIKEAITDSQVAWFREQASLSTVPAVAFQHIPTLSHAFVEGSCQGLHADNLAPLVYDGGIMEALSESDRFLFLAVGHNHGNDYCCPYQAPSTASAMNALHVCFGRHSGHGGYGKWERGSRVYQLQYNASLDDKSASVEIASPLKNKIQWSSWVRLESGKVIDRGT